MRIGRWVMVLLGAAMLMLACAGDPPAELARTVPDGTGSSSLLPTSTIPSTTATSTATTSTTATSTTAAPTTTSPPTTADAPPETTTAAPPETTTTEPAVDLTTIDWANRTYWIPCPGEPEEITLVDGEHRGTTFFHGLRDVTYGVMGTPARPVAVVRMLCIGAGNFPMPVLVFDGSGPEPRELGTVASPSISWGQAGRNRWQADGAITIDAGVLSLAGRGWTSQMGHCCPDLDIVHRVILDEDGTFREVEHLESARTASTTPG